MTNLLELESQIRDFINAPRRQTALFNNKTAWGMLCSSLDVIGDTEIAMESYFKIKEHSKSGEHLDHLTASGSLYIALYGILQILFVQQDAVKHLAEALRIDYAHDPSLKSIRDTRNDSIGHPTRRGKGKGETFNFISRMTLSRGGCDLLTLHADGSTETRQINVRTLIDDQRKAVVTALSGILEKLKEDEMAHRRKFRSTKLASAFSETLGYYHEKIYEAIEGRVPELGAGMLEDIIKNINDFKSELDNRGELESRDILTHELELLEYPIAELLIFLSRRSESKLNAKDAAIFHYFIREHLDNVIEIAREIDREYEQDV